VHRTVAGRDADYSSYVDLLEKQMKTDTTLRERVEALGKGSLGYLHGCNSHLVSDPKPGDFCIYTDENRKEREREREME
jgi:hypothetical protein